MLPYDDFVGICESIQLRDLDPPLTLSGELLSDAPQTVAGFD
jgi:hypothetical protein